MLRPDDGRRGRRVRQGCDALAERLDTARQRRRRQGRRAAGRRGASDDQRDVPRRQHRARRRWWRECARRPPDGARRGDARQCCRRAGRRSAVRGARASRRGQRHAARGQHGAARWRRLNRRCLGQRVPLGGGGADVRVQRGDTEPAAAARWWLRVPLRALDGGNHREPAPGQLRRDGWRPARAGNDDAQPEQPRVQRRDARRRTDAAGRRGAGRGLQRAHRRQRGERMRRRCLRAGRLPPFRGPWLAPCQQLCGRRGRRRFLRGCDCRRARRRRRREQCASHPGRRGRL